MGDKEFDKWISKYKYELEFIKLQKQKKRKTDRSLREKENRARMYRELKKEFED